MLQRPRNSRAPGALLQADVCEQLARPAPRAPISRGTVWRRVVGVRRRPQVVWWQGVGVFRHILGSESGQLFSVNCSSASTSTQHTPQQYWRQFRPVRWPRQRVFRRTPRLFDELPPGARWASSQYWLSYVSGWRALAQRGHVSSRFMATQATPCHQRPSL